MPPETAAASATADLLAALACPAVLVDAAGTVVAANAAAAQAGVTAGEAGALTGDWQATARRLSLADGAPGAILVWERDEAGLAQDLLALQKADTLGRLASGISHDLANSLGAILTFARFITSEPGVPADLRAEPRHLEEDADRTLRIIRTLLEFARHRAPTVQPVALGQLVRDAMELLANSLTNVEVRVTVPGSVPQVDADPALLRQALLALLVNCIEAMGGRWGRGAHQLEGRLFVSGRVLESGDGAHVRLAIEDGAPTVPEAERAALFATAGGARSGRDLSVARQLIEVAGGRLSHEPVPNGNRLVVELPIAGSGAQDPGRAGTASAGGLSPATSPVASPMQDRPLVLVCDDEPLIRGLLVRFIERAGMRAVQAKSANEALEILTREPVAMVITDHKLGTGDLRGTELYDLALTRRPDLATRFVLTSGDTSDAEIADFVARTGVPVVAKTFDNAHLAELVRKTVAG